MNDIHLAIIPDGNRRWAKDRALKPWDGHGKAIENFVKVLEFCEASQGVKTLTIWGFSTENWQRPGVEVNQLMRLFSKYLTNQKPKLLERKIRFCHSGRRDRIPADLKKLIEELEEETKNFKNFTLNLAIDHGGQDEIIRASKGVKTFTIENLNQALDHPELPPIDLVIRTSGEQRTSGFMMWQSAYAEWIFWPKHFPDFNVKALEECLAEFNNRKRRYGK